MRNAVLLATVISGVALYGAPPVGRPLSEVAVPVEKVTVPKEAVTVAEAAVTRQVPDKMPTLEELVAVVRNSGSLSERLAAFEKIWDQDAVFLLFFKPGKDRNVSIRKAAVGRMAEAELVKTLGTRIPLPEVKAVAEARLKAIYADKRDFAPIDDIGVVGAYARRTKARSVK